MIPDTQVRTLEQAQEKLRQAVNLNAHEEADYWRDWIKGYEEGRAEGELKKARETALSMLSDGLSVETISKYTGLSVQEIEALRKPN